MPFVRIFFPLETDKLESRRTHVIATSGSLARNFLQKNFLHFLHFLWAKKGCCKDPTTIFPCLLIYCCICFFLKLGRGKISSLRLSSYSVWLCTKITICIRLRNNSTAIRSVSSTSCGREDLSDPNISFMIFGIFDCFFSIIIQYFSFFQWKR